MADPWAPLLQAGLQFIERLGDPASDLARHIDTDPATGRQTPRIPLPDPDTVLRLASGLAGLLAGWRR